MNLNQLPIRFTNIKWIDPDRVFSAFDLIEKRYCCIKRLKLTTQAHHDFYLSQVSIYKLFSDHEITPTFLFSIATQMYGYIATELWHGPLESEDILPPAQIFELKTKLSRMHELGYLHSDLHDKNIIVKIQNGEIQQVALIDFEMILTFAEAQQYVIPYLLWDNRYKDEPELLDCEILEDICINHSSPETQDGKLQKRVRCSQ